MSWRPLSVLLLLAAALLAAWFLGDYGEQRASWVVRGLFLGLLLPVAVALWVLVAAPWSPMRRLVVAAMLGVAVLGAVAALRIDGVDGDLVPRVTWRWTALPTAPAVVDEDGRSSGVRATHDWPGLRGPGRDGIAAVALAATIGVRARWSAPLGPGYSACAVAGDAVYTMEQRGDEQVLVCLDLGDGHTRWRHAWAGAYATTLGGVGPRATPQVAGERVLACGARGRLVCCNYHDGTELWSVDLLASGGEQPEWAFSASPLVIGDLVVLPIAGSAGIVAWDLASGVERWRSGPVGTPGYASPVAWQREGMRLVLALMGDGLIGVDVADGQPRVVQPWPGTMPKVASPVVCADGAVVIAASYGLGGHCYELRLDPRDGLTPRERWHSAALRPKFSDMIASGERLYALDDGHAVCLALVDGRELWRGARYGHGQLLLAGTVLLVGEEQTGLLHLLDAVDGQRLASHPVARVDAGTWPHHLACTGDRLLIRDAEGVRCYVLEP